jgi:hypothetical protein
MGQSLSCLSADGPVLLTAATNGDRDQVRQVGVCHERPVKFKASPPHHPKNVNKTLLKVDLRYSTTSWQCADTRGQPSACGICPLERAAQLPALCSRYGCGAILALAATLTIRGNAQRVSVTAADWCLDTPSSQPHIPLPDFTYSLPRCRA